MGVMLRGMINKLVELSVPNPTVCGLIVKGFKCTTYRLDLKAKHVYRMVELQEFLLPQESYQVGCLPTCIQALGQVKLNAPFQAHDIRYPGKLIWRVKKICSEFYYHEMM
ncbi:hypothetical protein BDB00DRAFT_787391 [Zychaea mexicana]|uniref:uncharacterized protein n=1 Tax=Zychaea mexicana TaxID=64656 RepID=UPI0022FE768B|nr:uncharacterized protein BDB00DRAFT_787391 [Zychaea mexicana]KAI9494177.1 hypothetical protein BDB00DRAFT_787391 [Zychaea mexicana]